MDSIPQTLEREGEKKIKTNRRRGAQGPEFSGGKEDRPLLFSSGSRQVGGALAASLAQKCRGNSHCSQRLRAGWLRKVQAVQFQCVPSSSSILLSESEEEDKEEVRTWTKLFTHAADSLTTSGITQSVVRLIKCSTKMKQTGFNKPTPEPT